MWTSTCRGRRAVTLRILFLSASLLLAALPWTASAAPVPDTPETALAVAESTLSWQEATKMFAAALAIALPAFATAMTQCRIGSAGVGALAENPKLFGSILIYLVIPETMVILGFVIAAMILF